MAPNFPIPSFKQRNPHENTTSCCFQTESPPIYGKYVGYGNGSNSSFDRTTKKTQNKPSQKKIGNAICHGSHAANIRTKGAHEFYNMMWDPSIYRGTSTKSYANVELDRFKRWKKKEKSTFDADNLVKRRKFPRHQNKIGGIHLPKVIKTEQQEKITLASMGLQTEQFLEELTTTSVKKDMCTQSVPEASFRRDHSFIIQPFSMGSNQATQCNLGQALFEEEVEPVNQEFSKKILEQSLLETTEELELEFLRKEKRAYMEERRQELFRVKRILNAQREVAQERELALANERQQQLITEEAESRVGAALFSSRAMSGMMPIAFNVLQLERYLESTGAQDIYQKLLPYLDKELSSYYNLRTKVSRKMLDDLLHQVTKEREAEIADAIWNRKDDHREPQSSSIQGNSPPSYNTFSIDYIGGSMPFDIDQFRHSHE